MGKQLEQGHSSAGRFGPSHRWRVLGIGVAANGAVAAAFAGIPATAVFIRSGYQLNNAAFGWVIGAMGLGLAVSELPWGLVTDRLEHISAGLNRGFPRVPG